MSGGFLLFNFVIGYVSTPRQLIISDNVNIHILPFLSVRRDMVDLEINRTDRRTTFI